MSASRRIVAVQRISHYIEDFDERCNDLAFPLYGKMELMEK